MIIKFIVLFLLLFIASACDIKTKKIPNFILYAGTVTFLLFDFIIYPVAVKVIVSKVIFIIFLFFFGSLRLLGMGDIKLWMVITGYLGIINSCIIIFLSSVILIIFSIIRDKENLKIVFLTVNQIINKEKMQIVKQKSYPFAPFMTISTVGFSVLMMLNLIS